MIGGYIYNKRPIRAKGKKNKKTRRKQKKNKKYTKKIK
tara:strand:+ start:1329 stop:1442 length:114 start_codon:yes stop_codon:yes gene_type:complete